MNIPIKFSDSAFFCNFLLVWLNINLLTVNRTDGIHNWSISCPCKAPIRFCLFSFMFAKRSFCNLIFRLRLIKRYTSRQQPRDPSSNLSPKRPNVVRRRVWQTRRKHRCVNIKSSNFSFAREIFYKWSEFASLKRDKFIRATTRRIFLFLIKMQIVDASVKDSLCGWLFNGWSLKRPSKSLQF